MAIMNNSNDTIVAGENAGGYITNNGNYVTIDARGGADFITNTGSYVSIYGGDGSDEITLSGGSNITVKGGAVGDKIFNDGASKVTYQFGKDEGVDTISGFTSSDTLYITSGNFTAASPTRSGQDFTFKLSNNNNYRAVLKDVKPGTTIHWVTSDGTLHETLLPNILYGKSSSNNTNLENDKNYITIVGGNFKDTITNTGANVIINGGNGSDSITNDGNYVSIFGGAGNDYIKLLDNTDVTVNGGAGSDTIINSTALHTEGVRYFFGENDGADVIVGFNSSVDTLIFAAAEVQTLQTGQNITFTAGNTSVVLKNADAGSTIKYVTSSGAIKTVTLPETVLGTTGNDNIVNTVSEFPILAYEGADYIENYGDSLSIDAGAGNDTILNYGDYVTVNGGADKDSITNGTEDAADVGIFSQIYAGAGNDTITNYANLVTIEAGAGDDVIKNSGSAITYRFNTGDGNDTIYGFHDNDCIDIVNGGVLDWAVTSDCVKITISGGGVITLKDVAIGTVINLIEDGDAAEPITVPAVMNLTANGSYENYEDLVNIIGSNGKETIANYGEMVNIYSNNDNDVIENWARNVAIDGGGGADTIYNSSNDLVTSENAQEYYEYLQENPTYLWGGDGRDVIENWQRFVMIYGGNNEDSIMNYSRDAYIYGGDGADTITTWGGYVYGGKGNDVIILPDDFNESDSVFISYDTGDGNDTIYGFNTADALQVTDHEYSIDDGDLEWSFDTSRVTRKGKDVFISTTGNTKITIKDYGRSKLTLYGIYYGEATTDDSADIDATPITIYDQVVATTDVTIPGTANADKIQNNNIEGFDDGYYINALGGNDIIENGGKDVTINAGTNNDYVLNANTNYVYGYYYKSNGSYIYQGVESIEHFLLRRMGQSASILGGAGADTIENYGFGILEGEKYLSLKDDYYNYDGEAIFDTLTAEADKYVVINGEADNDSIYNAGSLVSILGGAGQDTIINDAVDISSDKGRVTIDSGAGNDLIINRIHEATSGYMETDSELVAENVVVYQFSSNGGNDVIQGFNERDLIDIKNGSLRSAVADGDKVRLTFSSSGSVVLEDAIGKTINYQYISGGELVEESTVVSAAVTLTAFNDTYHNSNGYIHVTALAGDDYINTGGVFTTIDGGAGRDSIRASFDPDKIPAGNTDIALSVNGGAGNDWIQVTGKNVVAEGGLGHDYIFAADIEGGTLSGGKGNDTLWAYSDDNSSNTNLVIQYAVGDGRDLVIGYQEDYKIQITTGDVTSISVRNDDTIIKIGGGSIWLKDYTDAVTLVDANGDAIEVPDELGDILDDDLFMKFEARLADIAEIPAENYSAGKFEPTDYTSLAQDDNFVTEKIVANK